MRALRISLITLGLILLLATLAAGVFIATFDPDDHRERITRIVQERTGLSLSLDGPLDMTLYPWLSLSVRQLTLDEADGSPLLSLESGRFRIRLVSLLRVLFSPPLVEGQTELNATITDGEARRGNPPGPLRAEGMLEAESLIVAGIRLQDLRTELTGSGQDLRLAPFRADLYNGVLRGQMEVTQDEQGSLAIQSDLALSGVDLAPLSRDLTGATQLEGITDLNLSLATRGDSVDALRAAMDGSGSLRVCEGVLYGVDVAATLAQLEAMLRARRLLTFDPGEQTAFDTLTATLSVRNGVVRSDDLEMLAPGFQVTGQGVLLDLADNSIDYDLLATVNRETARTSTEEFNIGGYPVPIACSGKAASPSCAPDLGSILRRAIGNEIQRRVGDFLQRLSE